MSKWSRYQGVTAFVGMPGGGKSYGLAEMAAKALRRGMPVYSNAGFDIEGSTILSSFEDFAALQGPALVVWDELPLYFNSRKWAEFPDGMLYKFTQIRKDGLRLAYSTIHEDMVDVNIRRVTFWYWHCSAITRRLIRRTLWPPTQFRKANQRPYTTEWVPIRKAVYSLYDTHGKVSVQESVAERIDLGAASGGFVRPKLAGPVSASGGPLVLAPAAVGGGAALGAPTPIREARPMDSDPWGLPVADGSASLLGPDEGFVTMDRSSWPRV
jgi:hypothetical protein